MLLRHWEEGDVCVFEMLLWRVCAYEVEEEEVEVGG